MVTKVTGGDLHFVQFEGPDGVINHREAKRQARSHAVKKALERKRQAQQQAGLNFRVTSVGTVPGASTARSRALSSQTDYPSSSPSPSAAAALDSDPYQGLASQSLKLQEWLRRTQSAQAHEPVFSIADELVHPHFRFIFREDQDDPALLNAAMLTYSLAMTGEVDTTSLRHQNQALESLRARMNLPHKSASESTLAAILLLAGVDARLNLPSRVQLHMNAVQQLLSINKRRGIHLADGIKRAIFWQDLNSSVMTGSKRIVDHTTFAELQWKRDPFTPDAFTLAPGFQKVSHMLTIEFIEVLEDIHALQCIRDDSHISAEDTISMAQIDNHQASIQSRLVSLPKTSTFLDCCRLGAFLCASLLRCKRWPASVVPAHLSSQLLCKLQEAHGDPVWDAYPEVLVWLLCSGGAFASAENVRSEYVTLLRLQDLSMFGGRYPSWPDLRGILTQFIWSEQGFTPQMMAFWEEVHT